jgi:hypothetical protein
MRESVINRIYHETAGYWGAQLTNVDYLTPREFGSIFSRYLKLSPNQVAETVNDMVKNGDLELAGQLADWALTQYPGDETLRRAQELAFRKLKEKWQLMNVFKFIMYGEHIDDPTEQLPIGERPQGYAFDGARPGFDLGFSNASFAGPYEFTIKVGPLDIAGFGTVESDGKGNFGGTQELNVGNGKPMLRQAAQGTYVVYPDGTGVAHVTLTLPDGTRLPATFDYVVLEAEERGGVKLATLLQGVSREPAVDPQTGKPYDPPQLSTTLFNSVAPR